MSWVYLPDHGRRVGSGGEGRAPGGGKGLASTFVLIWEKARAVWREDWRRPQRPGLAFSFCLWLCTNLPYRLGAVLGRDSASRAIQPKPPKSSHCSHFILFFFLKIFVLQTPFFWSFFLLALLPFADLTPSWNPPHVGPQFNSLRNFYHVGQGQGWRTRKGRPRQGVSVSRFVLYFGSFWQCF